MVLIAVATIAFPMLCIAIWWLFWGEESRAPKEFRTRFRSGPVGIWQTYYGGGEDMAHGSSVAFRSDGTGMHEWWSAGEKSDQRKFSWKHAGDCCIDILFADAIGKWESIQYDFKIQRSEYGEFQIVIVEKVAPGSHPKLFPEPLVFSRVDE